MGGPNESGRIMMRLAMTLLWMLPAPGEAHQLWINVIESQEGGHYLAFVGHGHVLPMEETLVPDYGAVVLDHYDLIAPDGTRASLRVPDQSIPAKQQIGAGATVQDGGDIGLRKITLEEESPAGTWQLAAATPMSFFVRYKDRTGVERFASTPVAQIKDLGSVVTSTVYANFMKAQFITGDGEPAQPAPIGHALELVPQSDLRQVRVGDTVRFKVLLYGKALKDYGAYFTARSMSFGLNQLQHAPLRNGTGEIRIPAAGQWRVEVMKQGPTADFPGMEQYRGDWKSAEVAATFTFHVLP